MLDVLGLNPADPAWATGRHGRQAHRRRRRPRAGAARRADRRARGQGLGARRHHPRPDHGGRHRGRGHPATGPEVERVTWLAIPSARAPSRRPARATPLPVPGGRVRRGLEGRGPTPKASERPYHQAHKAAKRAEKAKDTRPKRRTTSDAEWAAGRNSVVELLRGGVPVTAIYVAEGAERDNRLREAFKLAAEQGVRLLEVTRNEMDRMTCGAVHQGLAARLPAYEYAHADDLLDRADEAKEPALDRGARLGHRPAQPRRRRPLGRRLRRARRADPRASRRRHDRVGVEDQRRCGRPPADRPDRQPDPAAQGLPGGGLHGRRPGRRRRHLAARAGRARRARRRDRSSWSSGPRARAWAGWWPTPATRSSPSRWPVSWSRSTPAWPPRSPSTRSRRPACPAMSTPRRLLVGAVLLACSVALGLVVAVSLFLTSSRTVVRGRPRHRRTPHDGARRDRADGAAAARPPVP